MIGIASSSSFCLTVKHHQQHQRQHQHQHRHQHRHCHQHESNANFCEWMVQRHLPYELVHWWAGRMRRKGWKRGIFHSMPPFPPPSTCSTTVRHFPLKFLADDGFQLGGSASISPPLIQHSSYMQQVPEAVCSDGWLCPSAGYVRVFLYHSAFYIYVYIFIHIYLFVNIDMCFRSFVIHFTSDFLTKFLSYIISTPANSLYGSILPYIQKKAYPITIQKWFLHIHNT